LNKDRKKINALSVSLSFSLCGASKTAWIDVKIKKKKNEREREREREEWASIVLLGCHPSIQNHPPTHPPPYPPIIMIMSSYEKSSGRISTVPK
jgi:hypothetical protein